MTPPPAAGAAAGAHHYVGLVRGINVGGNHRITMAAFRAVFEALGYTDVVTLLQSGNVVFTSPRPLAASDVAAIESAFAAAAGFPASFVILPGAPFRAVVAANPLLAPAAPAADGPAPAAAATAAADGAAAAAATAASAARDPSRLVITFLPHPLDAATPAASVRETPAAAWPPRGAAIGLPDAAEILPEELALGDHVVYSWHPEGISKSRLPAAFWKQLGPTYTARNAATADKLVALLDARNAAVD